MKYIKTQGELDKLIRVKGQESGQFYKVGKEFFNEIKIKNLPQD